MQASSIADIVLNFAETLPNHFPKLAVVSLCIIWKVGLYILECNVVCFLIKKANVSLQIDCVVV